MNRFQPPEAATDANAQQRIHRLEVLISVVLRTGVLASLALILIGAALSLFRHASDIFVPAAYQRLIQAQAVFPHTLRTIAEGVRAGHGQAVIMLGLMLLILTPVSRVAVSIVIFARQRDRTYTLLTLAVFLILLLSFVLGRTE